MKEHQIMDCKLRCEWCKKKRFSRPTRHPVDGRNPYLCAECRMYALEDYVNSQEDTGTRRA